MASEQVSLSSVIALVDRRLNHAREAWEESDDERETDALFQAGAWLLDVKNALITLRDAVQARLESEAELRRGRCTDRMDAKLDGCIETLVWLLGDEPAAPTSQRQQRAEAAERLRPRAFPSDYEA